MNNLFIGVLFGVISFVAAGIEPTNPSYWPTRTDPTATTSHWSTASLWPTGSPSCDEPFDLIGDRCVFVEPIYESNWHEASFACEKFSAQLVVLDSFSFYADLIKYIKEKELTERDYWVGASNETLEGTWQWVDGTTVYMGTPLWAIYGSGSSTYEQEPTAATAEDQDCGFLDKTRSLYMADFGCLEKKASICQQSLTRQGRSKERSVLGKRLNDILKEATAEKEHEAK